MPPTPLSKLSCQIGVNVGLAARLLRDGKLVAIPTETVYGLGANALDVTAVARVFAVKNRPHFDPLIVHVADRAWLARLVSAWPEKAERLANRFWPGPLTLVLPKTELVPDLVTSGLPTVAVRMPAHSMVLEVLRLADVPIAAPSANPFGRLSPTRAEHVAEQLGDRIDYILDGGPCAVGVESTVLQLDGDRAVVLRPGGVTLEDIDNVIGSVELPSHAVTENDSATSPGMLPQHYAPRTPLVIVDDPLQVPSPERAGLLTLQPHPAASRFAIAQALSPIGDLTEAAVNFFAALRRLDSGNVERIVATKMLNHGLGRALNDRLIRAAASNPGAPKR